MSCKGLVYKCSINQYLDSKQNYVYQERMQLMKHMSCSGCVECGYLQDLLSKDMTMDKFPIIDNIENGALYMLQITNISNDWETGNVDDYELEFKKLVKTN